MNRVVLGLLAGLLVSFGCDEPTDEAPVVPDARLGDERDASVALDAGPVDRGFPPDVTIDAQATLQPAGQPCVDNFDCQSGYCIQYEERQLCSATCAVDGDCPPGWACRDLVGIGRICFPRSGECDGVDLSSDPFNCGACNRRCDLANAEPYCEAGRCAISQCVGDFYDIDADAANGCEYACVPTEQGVERCDEVDNDCDGNTDEETNLQEDLAHCGACDVACSLANARPVCVEGRCAIAECLDGFQDGDDVPANGCEEPIVCDVPSVEVCDNVDNDCDNVVDEGIDLLSDPENCGACRRRCVFDNAVGGCLVGQCDLGACLPGFDDQDGNEQNGCEHRICAEVAPEACDGIDNDCDERTDEDFDLESDVSNCGRCGNECDLANARESCVAGACDIAACLPGFTDQNQQPEDGCEEACEPRAEICDSLDNDCDTVVDEGFDLLVDPSNCGECNHDCGALGYQPLCVDGRCSENCRLGRVDANDDPADGCECVPTGRPDVLCDGVDDNCDGVDDELFDGEPCGIGACERPRSCEGGVTRCEPGEPTPEACNGTDDDCDGRTDEGTDLQADPQNCGACGTVCDLPNATAWCSEGECAVTECSPGFTDMDGDPANGCELRCVPAAEVCDLTDNDCDGSIDEDIAPEPTRCGSGVCSSVGEAICEQGVLVDSCVPGRPAPEACDGLDNDCDDRTDEGIATRPTLCGDGACAAAGELACQDGSLVDSCVPDEPGVEQCDGLDNDCDLRIDEAFDFLRDPAHCGRCDDACGGLGYRASCLNGRCSRECEPGRVDANRDPADGCECEPTGLPDVLCDGRDDDCDGRTDEAFEAAPCGVGECTRPAACIDGVEECTPAQPVAERCNGADDDCDGHLDEGLGTIECGVGTCRRSVNACVDGRPNPCIPIAPPLGEDDCPPGISHGGLRWGGRPGARISSPGGNTLQNDDYILESRPPRPVQQ